jgi:hypothetical protein
MKSKKFSRKLSLNKKTIAHLIGDEMKYVYGGEDSNHPKFGCPLTITGICCPSYLPPGVSVYPVVCECDDAIIR